MLKVFLGILSVFVGTLSTVGADEPGGKSLLSVGDPAPALQVGKWIQGGPVTHLEKGKVYLIEFWGTWCGPCRVTIPHINAIHQKYARKGLNVIGVALREEDPKFVPRFIKMMGDKMTYPIVLDDGKDADSGKMDETWMGAAGSDSLPMGFLINREGVICYLGNPIDLTDAIIESVLNDKIDVKAARATYLDRREKHKQILKLQNEVEGAAAGKRWAEAEKFMDQIEKLTAADDLDSFLVDRLTLKLKARDLGASEKFATALVAKVQDKARILDGIAWTIALAAETSPSLVALGLQAIERARKLTEDQDASVLETAARLQFMSGQKSAAILTQQKAVAAVDEDKRARFEKVLKGYKEGRLPEE